MRKSDSSSGREVCRRTAPHSILVALVIAVLAVLRPSGAHAIADHLTCYSIKDPQPRATYTGTLLSFPADDRGGGVFHPGCVIRMPAKVLCQATSKSLVDPTPPGAADGIQQPNSFLCYKVKCPGQLSEVPLPVHDQFGARTVTRRVPKILCAPAAGPTTTTTTTSTSSTTTTSMPPFVWCDESAPTCNGGCLFGVCTPVVLEPTVVCACDLGS